MYTCGLTVVSKRLCYVVLCYKSDEASSAKDDVEHLRSPEQHMHGFVRLARYDFLLVFYSTDLSRGTVVDYINYAVKVSETNG